MVTERIIPSDSAPVKAPTLLADALPLLLVGAAFVLCLLCIGMGIYLAVTSNSHAIAVLAALGCAGVIYGTLGRH